MKQAKFMVLFLAVCMAVAACSSSGAGNTNTIIGSDSGNVCAQETSEDQQGRFAKICDGYFFKVVYDKETCVEYAVSDGPNSRGVFTMLVDANGHPLLYEVKKSR